MAYVPMFYQLYSRNSPLGPASIAQIRQNTIEIERLRQVEHLPSGDHNAREVPWVVGHINGTTGYLFDTAYGGGTITQPATGTTELSVVSGVIPSVLTSVGLSQWDAQVLANVSDADIANTPHIIAVEPISATAVRTYIKRFIGTLGVAGNSWEDVDRVHDVAIFSSRADSSPVAFENFTAPLRGDYLNDEPTGWQAIARDQHALYLRNTEHRADGTHKTPRIPFAQGWCRTTGSPVSGYELADGDGIASVTRVSEGIIDVTTTRSVSSSDLAACFPQVRPESDTECAIINGRATGTNTFRFFIYVGRQRLGPSPGPPYFEWRWEREDRAFNFGTHGQVTT